MIEIDGSEGEGEGEGGGRDQTVEPLAASGETAPFDIEPGSDCGLAIDVWERIVEGGVGDRIGDLRQLDPQHGHQRQE